MPDVPMCPRPALHPEVFVRCVVQTNPAPEKRSASLLGDTTVNWVWHELNSIQRTHRHVNTTNAADWLIWAEQALDSTPIDKPQAMYCVMRARYSLAKAQEFAEWDRYGYFTIAIESLYLIGIPIVTVLYSNQSGIATSELMIRPIFQVPLFVFVWGFLGGVSWSIYSAAYWSKRRLFDRNYLSWYLAHPWISAVLGGAVALIVLGGLASFGSFDANTQPGSALLALVGFVQVLVQILFGN